MTDLHLGLKSNSVVHNNDCLEFMIWAADLGKKNGCDVCLFLGDYHNNRSSVNIMTLSYSLKILEHLSKTFDAVYFIPGNHDIYHRDRRDVQSLEWAKHIKNVVIVNDWYTSGDVTFAPWLIGDDFKKIKKLDSKYVFGHLELPTFLMNARISMPDHGEVNLDDFSGAGHVFSGHFHKRQTNKNITYIGNCFPHNYSDVDDEERGVMILEWGKQPVYHSWPNQPTFSVKLLSDIVENPDKHLKKNANIRANTDVELSYEEAAYVKETLVEQYGLRELTFIEKKLSDINSDDTIDISFQSVDQIVFSQLNAIDSEKYDPKILIELYKNL